MKREANEESESRELLRRRDDIGTKRERPTLEDGIQIGSDVSNELRVLPSFGLNLSRVGRDEAKPEVSVVDSKLIVEIEVLS